ncbi:MAG: hypothetical protein IKF96_05850 [Eggerthellaceae bacterium]|nr:hypothetical protein [Eggerthellaceae bacterium]
MKLRSGLLVGLFAIIVSLIVAPLAFADKNLQFYGVQDEPFYMQLGDAYATQQSNTFYIAGDLPSGCTISQSSDGHKDYIYLDGTTTERGTFIFELYWYEGNTSKLMEYFYVVVTVFGKPSVTIGADSWDLDVGQVAKLYANVEKGSGHYSYTWYVQDPNHTWKQIGSDLYYLPYPTSGSLTLADDGRTFKVEVEDLDTGFWGESAPAQITLTCKHSYSAWKVDVPATCTDDEVLVRTCSKCGRNDYKYGAAAKGHTWSTWSTEHAATCSESEVLVRTCTVCGATDHKMGVGPTGHTWGAWTASGSDKMTHSCTQCGLSETTDIVAGIPFIKTQPVGGSVFSGMKVLMIVEATASGLGDLTYQWMYCETPGGNAMPAPGSSTDTSYETGTPGYYFVRVTQTAGSASNFVDSNLAYVHVHVLSAWIVDKAAGTVSRECTDANCGLTESYTIEQFCTTYPSEAKALGLIGFKAWYKNNTGLFWGIVAGAALLIAAIVLLVILISRNKKLREMQGGGVPAPDSAAPKPTAKHAKK